MENGKCLNQKSKTPTTTTKVLIISFSNANAGKRFLTEGKIMTVTVIGMLSTWMLNDHT